MKYAYSSLKSTATNFVVLQSKHFAMPSFSFISFISPVNIYLFKVNNRSTRKRCEICSKLTIKTTERRHWLSSGVFIANFERISDLFMEFLWFTLNKLMLAGSPSFSKHSNVANGIIFYLPISVENLFIQNSFKSLVITLSYRLFPLSVLNIMWYFLFQ